MAATAITTAVIRRRQTAATIRFFSVKDRKVMSVPVAGILI